MSRPRTIRIPPLFFCPLGLAIVSLCRLILAVDDAALIVKHDEPLYLGHVVTDLVELILFGWKAYRLSRADSKQSRKRARRSSATAGATIPRPHFDPPSRQGQAGDSATAAMAPSAPVVAGTGRD